jgi:hypothetical protein
MASTYAVCYAPRCDKRLFIAMQDNREQIVNAVIKYDWDMLGEVFCCTEHKHTVAWTARVSARAKKEMPAQERADGSRD